MKQRLITIACCLCLGRVAGQQLERSVLATAGARALSATGSLDYTLGETATSLRQAASTYWCEGFQQTLESVHVPVINVPEEAIFPTIYPNPAHDLVYVSAETPLQLRLYDATGRLLFEQQHTENPAVIRLAGLPAGLYLLQLVDPSGRLAGTARVQHY